MGWVYHVILACHLEDFWGMNGDESEGGRIGEAIWGEKCRVIHIHERLSTITGELCPN
jgi:hypothetical protein